MVAQPATGWRALSKRNAFLIHLALSLLLFMTLVMLMVTLWFPGELFFLDGGWQGLKLVALVDLVLGPALTLLLYKPGKPKLVLDMSLIAVIQIAALSYGFVTTYAQRTVAMVFAENKFNTLSQPALEQSNQNLIERKLQPQVITALDNRKPAVLITPADEDGFAKYFEDLLNGFPQLHERSDMFVAAINNFEQIRNSTVTDKVLEVEDPEGLVTRALAKQQNKENIGVFRFSARYGSGFALYDQSKSKIVDYIKIETQTPTSETEVAESPE